MRKLSRMMISLLLGATMVAPIAAQAQEQRRGSGGWQRGGGDGGQRGGGDGQRGGWQRGGDGAGQRAGGDHAGRRGGDRGAMVNGDARREAFRQAREAQRQVERPAPVMQPGTSSTEGRNSRGARDGNNDRRNWDGGRRDGNREGRRDADRTRDSNREGNRDWRGDRRDWDRDGHRNWSGERRSGNRDGNRNWSSDRRDWDRNDNRRWNRDWRGDRRYSWQDYRTRHRNIYRLPRYEARHGHSYRRWYPGYRWDSWFYASSFWISDPWQYRLPPAYPPYRWVRYYDDVVLVDTETGEIADIIYNFFW